MRPMTSHVRTTFALAFAAFMGSCGDPTGPGLVLTPNTPVQTMLTDSPFVEVFGDSLLVIELRGVDSTLHRSWRPTEVQLSVNGSGPRTLLAKPFACLTPSSAGHAFPFSLQWHSCERIAVVVSRSLDDSDRRDIERAAGGSIILETPLETRPGALVNVLVPIGKENTAAAVDGALSLGFVEAADRENAEPLCVTSDMDPPPPCPPWSLFAYVPLSSQPGSTDEAVGIGDDIEVTYVQSDGRTLARVFHLESGG